MKPFLFNHLEPSTRTEPSLEFDYSADAEVNVSNKTGRPLFEGLTEVDSNGVFGLRDEARALVNNSLHSTETRTFTEEEPPDEDDASMLALSVATETLTRNYNESADPDTQNSDHILLGAVLATETATKSREEYDPIDSGIE